MVIKDMKIQCQYCYNLLHYSLRNFLIINKINMNIMKNNIILQSPIQIPRAGPVIEPDNNASEPLKNIITFNLSVEQSHSPQQSSFNHRAEIVCPTQRNSLEKKSDIRFSRFSSWHLVKKGDEDQIVMDQPLGYGSHAQSSGQQPDQSQEILFTPSPSIQIRKNKKVNLLQTPKSRLLDKINNTLSDQKYIHQSHKQKQTGLRRLSSRAFLIVKELGQATYKDVAAQLIKQVNFDQFCMQDEKEENNIKRRVYDALNVLIALGLLKKVGKNIVYEQNGQNSLCNLYNREQKQRWLNSLQQKKRDLITKKQIQRQIQQKIKNMAYFIQRNKKFIGKALQNNNVDKKVQIQDRKINLPINLVVMSKKLIDTILITQNRQIVKIPLNKQCFLVRQPEV